MLTVWYAFVSTFSLLLKITAVALGGSLAFACFAGLLIALTVCTLDHTTPSR